MNRLLKVVEIPYFLTILLALLGWSTVHFVNRYTDSPMIEWDIKKKEIDKKMYGVYTVRNVSRKNLFENLVFSLHMKPNQGNLITYSIERIPPAVDMEVYPAEKKFEKNRNNTMLKIEVDQFHPMWETRFIVETSQGKYPDLNVKAQSSLNLVRSSLGTFIIKYEIEIILGFIILWIILILMYLLLIKNSDPENHSRNAAPVKKKGGENE